MSISFVLHILTIADTKSYPSRSLPLLRELTTKIDEPHFLFFFFFFCQTLAKVFGVGFPRVFKFPLLGSWICDNTGATGSCCSSFLERGSVSQKVKDTTHFLVLYYSMLFLKNYCRDYQQLWWTLMIVTLILYKWWPNNKSLFLYHHQSIDRRCSIQSLIIVKFV